MKQTTVNEDYFKSIDHSNKAYFLGLLYADGNLYEKRKRILLNLKEEDGYIVERFRNELQYTGKLQTWNKEAPRQNQKVVSFYNETIYEDLIKLGLKPNKTITSHLPNIPEEYIPDFIRGFFDGDGCIYVANKRVLITIICLENIYIFLKEYLNKHDIEVIFTTSRKYNVPTLGILNITKKEHMYKFFKLLYYSEDLLYLKRKFKKFVEAFIDKKLHLDSTNRLEVIKLNKNNDIIASYPCAYDSLGKEDIGIRAIYNSCLKFRKTNKLTKSRFVYKIDWMRNSLPF